MTGINVPRKWIWIGAATLPVVFAVGVWAGGGEPPAEETAASSTTSVAELTTTSTSTTTSTTTTIPASTTSTTRPTTSTTAAAATTTTSAQKPVPVPPGWSAAMVVDVIDGDTIDVRLGSGGVERVRLIGTNSPEGGECYADEATAGLTGMVEGETVHLEPDVSDRDQYGRLLRYVWTTDGVHVNAVTVEQGWALAREYPPDTARADELAAAQNRAEASGAGMWASDACGAAVPADVRITNIHYDAAGDDNQNLNDEWAEITNADSATVDLTGWVLKDESASHRYRFPSGFALAAGAKVRVYTGCGQDTATALYWCNKGSAVWNNSGDTGFLLDPSGNIVYTYSYG